jgi:transcriptional regulator with XRE-family HTH domain
MVANTKDDFAKRINLACLNALPPIPEGRGRTAELCRRVKKAGLTVSGESVRKWLAGESIPSMDNIRFIARALGVNTEWLLTGNLTYTPANEQKCQEERAAYGFDPVVRDVIGIM